MVIAVVLAIPTIVALPKYVAPGALDPISMISPVLPAPTLPKVVAVPTISFVA